MTEKTNLNHVALTFPDKISAAIFFKEILDLSEIKSFEISNELSKQIFGISENIFVIVFGNNKVNFEVFITDKIKKESYEHVCVEIENKEEFIKRCRQNNIEPIFVKKEDRTLLFIRDYSGNLYEIKEKIG